ncbi:MAG: 6-phosphofructokinase [Verrucomicrobia bacterium]|nr:6-phosphofructokinase [Verrucomicrobiota bacterium]
MLKKRIGILTSGGDCPGLNAVIRGVVRAADKLNWEVIGFVDGFEGLLAPGDYRILDRHTTATIMSQGGTILGTTNKGHFVSKVGKGDKTAVAPETVENAREILGKLRVEGLILVGGDGSLTTGLQLFEAGFPIIGVPKTIDNDLEATAMTFGFDSAVACVVDALDRLQTTGSSHKRIMVLEVMGRHAGWIALYGGLAGGANAILLPEIPFTYEKLANYIRQRDRDGYFSSMVVVAEGATTAGGTEVVKAGGNGGEYKLGGIGEIVSHELATRTGKETRHCVLGHLQRGGAPTTLDRLLGTRFGVGAVDLIRQGRFGQMVSYQNYQVLGVPIAEAVNKLKRVTPDNQVVQTARAVDVCFGD